MEGKRATKSKNNRKVVVQKKQVKPKPQSKKVNIEDDDDGNENILSVLKAIDALLSDLCVNFKNKKIKDNTSLDMFSRLVKGLTKENTVGIQKVIESFNKFFLMYDPNQEDIFYELPKGAMIKYSDRIYLNIQKFIYDSSEENKDAIVDHLIYISALLVPSEESQKKVKQSLKKKNENTPEGQFIKNVMKNTESIMGDMDKNEVDNPATVIAKLASSGSLNQMVKGIQNGVENKQMDPRQILNVLHQTADNFFATAKDSISTDKEKSSDEGEDDSNEEEEKDEGDEEELIKKTGKLEIIDN
jgi:hypothetical protein